MARVIIRHYDSISAVDERDWVRLTHHSPFTSYAWLDVVCRYSDSPSLHLLLAYEGNDLHGAMVLERVTDRNKPNGVVRAALGGNPLLLSMFGNFLVPNLATGVPHGYGGHLLLADHDHPEHQLQLADELTDAAEALSATLDAPLWFSGVLATDKLLLTRLRNKGYLSAHYLPLAELPIQWETFAEYLEWQRQRSRNVLKDIRREQNRCRAAGVSLEEPAELVDMDSVFIELANQTYKKYGNVAFPFVTGFFAALKDTLPESLLVCTARKDDRTVGFVTMLSDGQTAWADSYGMDYEHTDGAFVYFNLVHHWPVQKAIELGLKRIVFGRGQYSLKLRRGCELTDTFFLYNPSRWLARKLYTGFFRIVDKHYAGIPTAAAES